MRDHEPALALAYIDALAAIDGLVARMQIESGRVFDEILRGLRIVHQHKMLHLDIKPANIMIAQELGYMSPSRMLL